MSLPRYSQYKDTGEEWMGEVPAHWEVLPLGRVTLAKCDGPFGSGLKSEHYTDSGVRVVRLQNIRRGDFNGSNQAFIDESYFANELSRHDVRESDLLIAGLGDETNTVGRACVAPRGIEPAMVKADCFRFRLNLSKALPRFVAMQLTAGSGPDAARLASGSTRSRIPLSVMSSRRVTLPPLYEQKAIVLALAGRLAQLDSLVADQQRLVELLKEKRQAVITRMVTKGLNTDVSMKYSGAEWLGDVPAHWELVRLGRIFRETMEPGHEALPVLSVSIHHGVSDKELNDEELDRKVTRSEDRTKYKRVMCGDLVYNMMRAWQGGFGTVGVEGMVSPAYVVARPRQSLITEYIEHLLRTPQAIEQMRRHSKGVTDFRLRLYWDEFKNLRIALPPVSEAKVICEQISRMDEESHAVIGVSKASIALLQERRSAVISAAVTGKIDVRHLADAEVVLASSCD